MLLCGAHFLVGVAVPAAGCQVAVGVAPRTARSAPVVKAPLLADDASQIIEALSPFSCMDGCL